MRQWIMVSAAALALAGCGETESTEQTAAESGEIILTNASAEDVAAQARVANMRRMQPGLWEQTIEIVEANAEGMPEGAEKAMMSSMLQPGTRRASRCLTQAETERNNVAAMATVGKDCFYHRLRIADGRMDGHFTCKTPQGDEVESRLDGSYTPTSLDLTIDSTTDFAQRPGTFDLKMRITSNRTGDCSD